MTKKEISIDDLCVDILTSSEFLVDIDSLICSCSASPIHAYFKTDKIVLTSTYPESILLNAGGNYINISQIKRILRITADNGKTSYEIVCGFIDDLERTITISQF